MVVTFGNYQLTFTHYIDYNFGERMEVAELKNIRKNQVLKVVKSYEAIGIDELKTLLYYVPNTERGPITEFIKFIFGCEKIWITA